MILQALCEYYERKREAEQGALPDPGFERREIPFIIVLNEEGRFIDLEDTREGSDRKSRARVFTVPQSEKRPGTKGWKKAFLLWDHPGYVLGFSAEDGDEGKATRQHARFIETIRETLGQDLEDKGVLAVLRFLGRGDFSQVYGHPLWADVAGATSNYLSFRLEGEHRLVCQRPAVRSRVARAFSDPLAKEGQCLITGEHQPIARLHPAIKGVRGANVMGPSIVSFNLEAFESYGRNQGFNAPVGEGAAFAYTTALNALLAKGSRQKVILADATIVFWAGREHEFESLAAALLGGSFRDSDDPDRGVDAIRSMYASPGKGSPPLRDDWTAFYVLALSPNASRIAIRFWERTTVAKLAKRLMRHFEDVEIERPPKLPRFVTTDRLLRSIAVQGDRRNIPANLAGETVRSILTGAPYPRTLFMAAIERNRREQGVTPDRAALIKAVLARDARRSRPSSKEVGVSLDVKNTNVGYRLGRLFATVEKIQEEALPGIQRTLRERFYSSASSAPVAVFPRLMSLKNHHLGNLEHEGRKVYFDKLIGEIVDGVDDFPPVLDLPDQGRFSIGYHHQRQTFFRKRDDDKEGGAM